MALVDKLTDLTSFDYDKVGQTNRKDSLITKTQRGDSALQGETGETLPPEVKGRQQAIKTALDVSTSTKGALFKTKQFVLHSLNASNETRVYDPTALEKSLVKRDDNFIKLPFGNRDFKPVEPVSQNIQYDAPKKTTLGLSTFNDDDKRPSRRIGVVIDEPKSSGLKGKVFYDEDKNEVLGGQPKDFIKFYVNDPVGKRIIQFPAYLTDITDNSSGEYNPTRYIGRADQVYVYTGYSRSISFGFRVAALTRGDIPLMWKKIEAIKSLTLPAYQDDVILNDNDLRPVAPFVELTIGDLYKDQPGYFNSVNITIPQGSNWETEEGYQLTHLCDVSLEYTFIGKQLPNILGKQFDIDGYDKDAGDIL